MAPSRIMIIRHAEKPDAGNGGVALDGTSDPESLTVRGWQRAGALVSFFTTQPNMRPSVVFAAGVGPGSKSRRPIETVMPLGTLLMESTHQATLITDYLKDDLQPLIEAVLSQQDRVLISWEHKRIPDLVAMLPDPPLCPPEWPDERFDLIWVLDRDGTDWNFTQVPQLLLAGDRAEPIT